MLSLSKCTGILTAAGLTVVGVAAFSSQSDKEAELNRSSPSPEMDADLPNIVLVGPTEEINLEREVLQIPLLEKAPPPSVELSCEEQAIELLQRIKADSKALEELNLICPDVIGEYREDAIIAVGGFPPREPRQQEVVDELAFDFLVDMLPLQHYIMKNSDPIWDYYDGVPEKLQDYPYGITNTFDEIAPDVYRHLIARRQGNTLDVWLIPQAEHYKDPSENEKKLIEAGEELLRKQKAIWGLLQVNMEDAYLKKVE